MKRNTAEANLPAALPTAGTGLASRPLTARQEAFAVAYVNNLGDTRAAYESAYGCAGSSLATIRVNASRLLHTPRVQARIRELQERAGAVALRSTQQLVAELEESAACDPGELLQLWNGACRHCWGTNGAYQWRDVDEYCAAVEHATHRGDVAPSFDGGVGYDFHRGANPECRACDGVGLNRVRFNSSPDVSPGARRLLRGIELHNDGTLKRVHLHDQMAMRMELHRLKGMHIDRSMTLNVNATLPTPKDLTPEQALAYLDRLKPLP
jgi:hypothetical protein